MFLVSIDKTEGSNEVSSSLNIQNDNARFQQNNDTNIESLTNETNIDDNSQEEYAAKSDENSFDLTLMKLLTKLHSDSSLSRKFIDELYKMIQFDIVDPILNLIADDNVKERIKTSFDNLNSFYKFKKKLKEQGKSTHAEQRIVSEKTDLVFKNGNPKYETVTDTISLMPIQQQIKLFFELPNILDTILDYMRQLEQEKDETNNFIQGKIWKNIKQNFNHEDIVIPCFLYHDDFAADSPLSSNTANSKIAAFYYSFPVIPQHLLSSPNYIFDALFFRTSLKNNDLAFLLDPLIEIFKELEEEGLILNINGKEIRIYVVLSLIIGDNLALNELIGLTKSFNSSYFCRFCLTPKEMTNQAFDKRIFASCQLMKSMPTKKCMDGKRFVPL